MLANRLGRAKILFPLTLLALCLLLTAAVWKYADNDANSHSQDHFDFRTAEISNALTYRVAAYELALRGGLALFAAVDDVNRSQWREYVGKLNLPQDYPGIQGIGYSQVVPAAGLQHHIDTLRQEGFPGYAIRPPGERPVYTSIIYLEPFDARNQRAFGYDMFSDPVRHAAMERARDTGHTSISGKVTLVQETTADVQAGFLMYLPYYAPRSPVTTVEERRAALKGFVYSPFRMNDFMQGLVGKDIDDLGVEIFDDSNMNDHTLMYRSEALAFALNSGREPLATSVRQVDIMGNPWTIRFKSLPSFEAAIDHRVPRLTLGAGLCLSLLLFFIALSLVNTQVRAEVLANKMTTSLRESEKQRISLLDRLQLATQAAGIGIWEYDAVNNALVWDEKMYKLYGIEPDQFSGAYEAWESGLHPDDLEEGSAAIQRALKGIADFQPEFRIIWPSDKSIHYIKANALVERDENGNPVRMIGTNWDISERKLMEKALFEAGALQRAIFNSANFSSIATDAKGVIQIFNVGAERMLGYSSAEVMNKLTPADMSDPQEVIARAATLTTELGTPVTAGFEALAYKASRGIEDIYELTYVRKDGSLFPAEVSVTALRDDQDAIIGYLLIGRDNTAYKQAEKSKRESESLIHAITNTTNDAMVMMDPKGLVCFWNSASDHMFGYTRDEALGQGLHLLIAPERYQAKYQAGFSTFHSTGQGDVIGKTKDLFARRKDGEEIAVSLSLSAVNIRDGWYAVGIVRDVTELRRLEQLKENVERITKHDLKTPLNGIINIPMLLLDDDNLTEDQRDLLRLVELSGHKMLVQINSTLELYKIETGTYQLLPNEVDPVKLVQDNIDILARGLQFDRERITLQVHPAKADDIRMSIKTDKLLLDVIQMNILRNALEASDKNAQVVVDLSIDGKEFAMAISNSRPVPVEIRDRFFDKYATAGKSGGTGLGTYSAAIMTKALGGTIEMETSEETGTKVTVRIPMTA